MKLALIIFALNFVGLSANASLPNGYSKMICGKGSQLVEVCAAANVSITPHECED